MGLLMYCQYSGVAVEKTMILLTAGNCYIISMDAGSTDGSTVLAGEEVKIVGGIAVHIVQENCTITLTKTVRKVTVES